MIDSQALSATPNGSVYWRLFVCGVGIVFAASLYCVLHGFEYQGYVFDPRLTVWWTVSRWGAWPILLPACYWLIRFADRRSQLVPGIAVAAVGAVFCASALAFYTQSAIGGTGTLLDVLYHMAPQAIATFGLVLGGAYWFLSADTGPAHDAEPICAANEPQLLAVWKGSVQTSVDVDEIELARAARNYVDVFTTGADFIRRDSLKDLAEYLPSGRFMRVHRSYLVNTQRVVGLKGGKSRPMLVLESGEAVPVSKAYQPQVFALLRSLSITT